MQTKKSPILLSIGKACCSLIGHDYRVSNSITNHIKEYKCRLCGEEVTDTANGTMEKLTAQFKETNEYLAQFHKNRARRRLSKQYS